MSIFFKGIGAFLSKWRLYIYISVIISAGVVVFNYVDNHGEMKAILKSNNQTIEQQVENISTLTLELQRRNERDRLRNERELARIAEAKKQINLAREAVDRVRIENDRLREALASTRSNTLEAIRDDKEFADWANDRVPDVGWRVLEQANAGQSYN